MSNLPERVLIHEDAPREGFQSEPTFIPTETKIAFIEALANTGVREINCVSFVNPKRVPQMADSELVAAGLRRRDGVRYTGTWVNLQGVERALKSGKGAGVYARVATVPAGVTTYVETVVAGSYYYRVQAFNSTAGRFSAYSNVATVTVKAR